MSRTTVANWYIKNGELIYAVFLRGDSGWYNRHTDWHSGADSTGGFTQDLDVGGFRYSLVLDKDSHLSVLGKTVDVAKTNVVLIDLAIPQSLRAPSTTFSAGLLRRMWSMKS